MARETHEEQVGALYILPNNSPTKKIPFEFNPEISETNITAKFQSISILSRLGNLQAYTGSDSLSVSLNTTYIATAASEEEAEIELDGWMSSFTLVDLQKYELLFRSLTLPDYSDDSVSVGYKYVKPPLVKVIMGSPQEPNIGNKPFSNILTYPKQVIGNKLKNQTKFRNYRTFITTSVNIVKDLNELPIYLDDNNYLLDSTGYKVSLNLIEVTQSYSDMLPTFSDYYNRF